MKKLSYDDVMKEIDEKRNHSWIKEIIIRHNDELDREILDYFGNNITYRTLIEESKNLAKALKTYGLTKGSEFVVCIDRIPESVYLMAAASIIGANINFISEKFDKNYVEEIIKNSGEKIVFIQDNKLYKMNSVINDLIGYKIVTVSHRRSLPLNYQCEEILDRFYDNGDYRDNSYMDYDNFVVTGNGYDGRLFANASLDDALTTTYSSGTTKKGHPKGIVHGNRHYITMGRYHDPEVSGLPSLKNYSTYSNIPAYSNSYVLSTLSDNLILGGKIILDPIDDPEYFLVGSKIHKANVNIATTSTWLLGAMDYYNGDKYGIKTLPDALFNFVAGEQFSAGEEKFINRFFRDAKCGINLTHTPVSIAKASTAGADCEHGSIFIKLFRAYFNNEPYRIGRSEPVGMKPYDFVDIKVLRRDGTYCLPLEHGRLVVNSPCNMLRYSHNQDETDAFYIRDAYGNIWGDMNAYGFLDEKGNVSMKGRYNDDNLIPCYRIADEILKDTKKIMSCEVVNIDNNGETVYVAHIMPQYGTSFNKELVIDGAISRCINMFGEGIQKILYFRVHSLKEGYPLSSSVKRDIIALKEEGLTRAENYLYYNDVKTKVRKK